MSRVVIAVALLGCGSSKPAGQEDAAVPDLAGVHDLSLPDLSTPDLVEPEDLTVPVDLRRPSDPVDLRAAIPVCDKIGSKSEGWYAPDGALICWVQCSGAVAECRFPGTRSEGWYSSVKNLGCQGMDLIRWESCS